MNNAWEGFKSGAWMNSINVDDFINTNYTPYDGDESFLAGPTARTTECNEKVKELLVAERKNGGTLKVDASRIKAEIHYRIGMDYYHRPNTIDNLTVALKAFNTTELLLLKVMNEGNPSLIHRIQKLRQMQMEVKECLDEFILTPLEPLN